MDLTNLVLLAAFMLSLIVGDAAVSGGNLQLSISVPPKIAETGFSSETAESVFTAEAARIGRTSSIIPPPIIETGSHPGLFGALVKPLQLDQVAMALRERLGLDTTEITMSVVSVAPAPTLNLIATIALPSRSRFKVEISRPDGNVTALVEEATRAVMEQAVPYRVALADLTAGVLGDPAGFTRARDTAQRALARPFETSLGSQRVMLHNILAMLALQAGDRAEAERQFARSEVIPGASAAAHASIAVNRAFLAIADRDPVAARRFHQKAMIDGESLHIVKYQIHVELVGALIEWSAGNLDLAESELRYVAARLPDDDEPHVYLGRLLVQRGKIAEGEEQLRIGAVVRRFDNDIGPLAHTLFYVDPAKGGTLTRN